MSEVSKDQDQETSYKETFRSGFRSELLLRKSWISFFRVFSKDEEGCISADEIK